jgi:hypothetical protein
MADRKITQFEKFTGLGDTHTYFVIASGENAEPDTRNYRLDFVNMSEQVGEILFGGAIPFSGNDQCLHYGIFTEEDDRCVNIDITGHTKFSLRPDMGAFFDESVTITGTLFSESLIHGQTAQIVSTTTSELNSPNSWFDKVSIGNGYAPTPHITNPDGETFRLSLQAGLNSSPGGIFVSAATRNAGDDVKLLQINGGIGFSNQTCLAVNAHGKTSIGHNEPLVTLDVHGTPNTFGWNNEILKITAADGGSINHFLGFGVDSNNDRAWIRAYREGTEEDLHLQVENSTNGFVSIGKPTPLAKLHVGGNAIVEDDIHDSNGNRFIKDNEIGDGTISIADTDGQVLGTFTTNQQSDKTITIQTSPPLDPNGGLEETTNGVAIKDYNANWGDGALFISDENLKSSVSKIQSPISIAKSINGVKFRWNENADKKIQGKDDVGVIAQDVEKVLPEAVSSNSKSELSVYYHKIIPVLLECIKDQQDQIDSLGKRISDLENG